MLISLLQMQPVSGDVAANLAAIAKAAEAAAVMGAELLVTPELSTTGYALGPRFSELAEPRDGAIVTALAEISKECKLSIAAGFPERDGEVVYNSAVVVQPERPAEFYRKCHLFGDMEKQAFLPSARQPHVFDLGLFKAGMVICYDVEFPEMVRMLALAGADLVIVPTALAACVGNRRVSETLLPARAMENQVFIAYADLCGREGDLVYEGHSVIAAPDGDYLARAGSGETLLFARLVPGDYSGLKAELPYLAERRPELYADIARKK